MNDRAKAAILGFGLLGVGAVIYMTRRRQLSAVAQSAVDRADLFSLAIPSEAAPYAATILAVAEETGVDPFVIAAIGQRETVWGTSGYLDQPGPAGRGDNGHGHGLMQIDDRTWASWLAANDWTDPYTNIRKGAEIMGQNLDYFAGKGLAGDELIAAAAAGYNHGPGAVWRNIQAGISPDTGTAHGNYGGSILSSSSAYAGSFESLA
jgi:soluble lytic murein transglycosylase-like protein